MSDVVVVGAGLTGSVVARRLASVGLKVRVLEARDHVGGLCADRMIDGVMVQTGGPHVFHTDRVDVWRFLAPYADWIPMRLVSRCMSKEHGLLPIPVNRDTINAILGTTMTTGECDSYIRGCRKFDIPENAEQSAINRCGREVYDVVFKGYSTKQWGTSPTNLLPAVTERIPIRPGGEDSYFTDHYQCVPGHGFSSMISKLLDHENISLECGVEFRLNGGLPDCVLCVYTGALDALFDYSLGRLPYRGVRFELETIDVPYIQPYAVINYCDEDVPWTRTTEHKRITSKDIDFGPTVIGTEYPIEPTSWKDAAYPMMTASAMELAASYREMARGIPGLLLAGRLADYRYVNMDVAVARALELVADYLHGNGSVSAARP